MKAEQLTGPDAYHGEGPVWSAEWGGLRWVDMLAGDVLALSESGAVSRTHVGSVAAALRPRSGGGAVVGVERGFALSDADGGVRALPQVWSDSSVRMNDGACDPDGRFYCGSMAYDQKTGAAALFRLDPDLSVQLVFSGVTVSNGLDWSPDGTTAYYNDTATHRVDRFDYSFVDGLTGRRPFVDLSDEDASPDGLTVDAEGGVWTALHGMGQVRRYSPDGRLSEVVEVPTPQPTACALGGDNLDELFITTSRENMSPGQDPVAGAVFRISVGVRGMPVRTFAG